MIWLLAAALSEPPWRSFGLADPVRVLADGTPIDTEHGHAAPCLADLDRDGKPDLLVGQFEGGKLKVYRNTGTAAAPVFGKPQWFQAGGTTGAVSYG
ncbi:MAG: FG-GAP repeat protein [Armatimonadetes bacterium]|nr:FG-GAP repeat protein [Armatimonadota bacterium]